MIIKTATKYRIGGSNNTLPLTPYHQIFIDSAGMPYRIKGISAFNLLDLYSKGIPPEDFLRYFPNSNTVRIFLYTPVKDWHASAWGIPPHQITADFVSYLGKLSYRVWLCLLTDDDQNNIPVVRELVNYLKGFNFSNLLLAAGNEPRTNKNIHVESLESTLRDSGYLYTSGVYEDLKYFYGNHGDDHSGRDDQWVRKAKDVIECYRGGGPNYETEPACPVPWILGEPIRPDEAVQFGYNTELDYYTYASISGAMGAGSFFHSNCGKLCTTPSDLEMQCYNKFIEGLEFFPADTALGNYDRINEDPMTLRTYTIGQYAIRVRPVNGIGPLSGYRSIDSYGINWSK